MWSGGPKWTSKASSLAPLVIISFTTSALPGRRLERYWMNTLVPPVCSQRAHPGCRPHGAEMQSEPWAMGSLRHHTLRAAGHTPGCQQHRRCREACCHGWSGCLPGTATHTPSAVSPPPLHLWCCWAWTHLSSGLQQEAGAVGTGLNAGFVERCDVIRGHGVDRGSALYELLQLEGPALGRGFMQHRTVCPGTWRTHQQSNTQDNLTVHWTQIIPQIGLAIYH